MAIVTLDSIKKKQAKKSKSTSPPVKKKNEEHLKASYSEIFKENTKKKTVDKVETNRRQTVDKVETNRRQTVDVKKGNCRQSVDETVDTTVDKVETNRRQTVDKVHFSTLIGNQQKIVTLIYKTCRESASLISPPLTLDFISLSTGIPSKSLKKTIERLKLKGFLCRVESKNGRGGWTKYSIPQSVYSEMLNIESVDKLETNRRQTVDKVETERGTKRETNSPSSSSNLNINTTILECSFDEQWSDVIIPEAMLNLGYTRTHLKQLFQDGHFTKEEVQTSLDHYAYDLENNHTKPLSGITRHLHGVMRGDNKAPWVSEELTKQFMQEKLKRKKLAEYYFEETRKDSETELLEKAQEIFKGLSDERKLEFYPENSVAKLGTATHKRMVLEAIKSHLCKNES